MSLASVCGRSGASLRSIQSALPQPAILAAQRFSTAAPPQDGRIKSLADLVNNSLPKDASLKDILGAVWRNPTITAVCPDLVIRLTSLRGEVSKVIWSSRGNNPDDIQILAVGTTAIPQHLTKYHKFLSNFYNNASSYSLEATKGHRFVIGYDLLSKGDEEARKGVLQMFNEHFGFSQEQLQQCIHNSSITSGGMRGLKDIADACVLNAKDNGKGAHRFIQPDNSFGTWWNIIERPEKGDTFRREIHTIEAKPENKLQLSAQDVHAFYAKHRPVHNESWYITPVGNPSGTKISGPQLTEVCEAIVKHNPHAIIILDSVYVRTIPREQAKEMLAGVLKNEQVLNRVIFLESFSKSHGLCRERLGIYFGVNDELFTRIHTANITFSAGPGAHKDHQFRALGTMSTDDKQSVDELHQFWQTERKGLYNYLMKKNAHLFEDKQIHVTGDDINNPLGLYLLLKTKPGIGAQDVFVNTGVLGVDTPLLSGHYIRFAVGALPRPTYSKY